MSIRKMLFVLVLGVGSLSAVTASAAPPLTQTLTPPPPDFLICKTVGTGTICQGSRLESYGPDDTGIQCGSGTAAFDIFDQGVFRQQATRFYDRDGNLTRRVLHERYTSGAWSNPLSGASVSYTQNNIIANLLAVPGDFDSATETIRGEVIIRGRTAAPVFIAVGRQVFNSDESELISSAGRNGFIAAFFEGDPTAFDAVCAALA